MLERSRHFLIYFVSSVMNKLMPLILLPILTRFLSENEFGALAIYQLLLVLSVSVVGMNIQNNITKSFYDKTKDEIALLIGNVIFTLTLSLILWSVVSLVIYLSIEEVFSVPAGWFALLPFIAFCSVLIELLLTVYRNDGKPLNFAGIEVGRSAIELILTLYLVVVITAGLSGRLSAMLIAIGSFALFSVYILKRSGYINYELNRNYLREILLVSLPLIPHALAGASLSMSNRLFLERIEGTSAVAVFAVSYQFAMVLSLVTIALNRTWAPWLYKAISKDSVVTKNEIVQKLYIYWVAVFVISLIVTLASYFLIPIVVPPQYHAAYDFVIYLAVGYSFYAMYNSIFPFFVYYSRTKMIAVITFSVAIVSLLINFFLIQEKGIMGASLSFLISYLLLFIISFIAVNSLIKMPWIRGK
ncbi:lipopolysaccharide biosynthesis protein [Pseudidiomarina planktonica]|nr:oligosaccharide flippase family protein [Pseudidiomarina planktonica]